MLVIAAVGDIPATLVQQRGPVQPLRGRFAIQLRRELVLVEQGIQRLLNQPGMLDLDMVALGQRSHGSIADVLVVDAPQQIVQQAFTQGAVRNPHGFDAQRHEAGLNDGQTARETGIPFRVKVGKIGFVQLARENDGLHQALQSLRRDAIPAPAPADQQFMGGPQGAGRANGLIPLRTLEHMLKRFELALRIQQRPLEALGADAAVGEVGHAHGDAAHAQALLLHRRAIDADDVLRAAAANIHNQSALAVRW